MAFGKILFQSIKNIAYFTFNEDSLKVIMFENLKFATSLDEDQFDQWLIYGRESKIRYNYLIILWNDTEKDYRPVYLSERSELEKYTDKGNIGDVFVAGYDLFSESKIL